jgi:hypothetical protein
MSRSSFALGLVPELTLDHVERDAFASHLDGVRVAQLMRPHSTADARGDSELAQRRAGSRR